MNRQKETKHKEPSKNTQTEVNRHRGGATKAILLRHALKVFADNGYENTSTRDLSQIANVNQAAIAYYFDNKEGLLKAVNQWVATCISTEILPIFAQVEKELTQGVDSKIAIEKLVNSLFDAFWSDVSIANEVTLLRRELHSGEDGTYLRKQIYDPFISKVQGIIKLVNNTSKDSPEIFFRSMLLFDSLLFFNAHENSIVKSFGKKVVTNIKSRKELSSSAKEIAITLFFNNN